jgi:hypothetical protein
LAQDNAPPRSALSTAQQERARLLAEKTARMAVDTLADMNSDEVAEIGRAALSDMQQNVVANRTKAESQQRLKESVERRLQTRIDDEIARTVSALLADQGVSLVEFRSRLGAVFDNSVAAQKQKFVAEKLPPIFAAAREEAVKAQTTLLARAAYPTQQEVEQVDRDGWTETQLGNLASHTRERIAKAVPERFEETDSAVGEDAKKIMDDVQEQRKRQTDALDRPLQDNAITASQIETALRGGVDEEIAKARAANAPDRIVYTMLPKIAEKAANKAVLEEQRLWTRFVESYKRSFSLNDIEARLRSDIARYRDPRESERPFVEDSIAAAERDVVERYAIGAKSASDAAAFKERISASVAPTGENHQKLRSAIADAIRQVLSDARRVIADEQYATAFAPLQSGVWQPDEAGIAGGSLTPGGIAGFEQAAALPNVRAPSADPKAVLLIETENRVVDGARNLITEAQTAMTLQRGIVKRVEPKIKEQIENAPPEELESKDSWVAKMTDLVMTTWASDRPSVWQGKPPAKAPSKYSNLFAATNEDIKRSVQSLLAEIAKRPKPTPTPTPISTPTTLPEPGEQPNLLMKIVEIVGVIGAAALAIFLLWRWIRRPRKPVGQPNQTPGGNEGRSQIGGGSNPGRGGDGKDKPSGPSFPPMELFQGIVVEVRDLARTVALFDDLTDLRPNRRGSDYAYYKIGPLDIIYVAEGSIPDNVLKGGKAIHVELLQKRSGLPGPPAIRSIEGR